MQACIAVVGVRVLEDALSRPYPPLKSRGNTSDA